MLQLISILKHIIARNFSLRKKKFSHISCLSPQLTDENSFEKQDFHPPFIKPFPQKTLIFSKRPTFFLSGSIDKNNLVALTLPHLLPPGRLTAPLPLLLPLECPCFHPSSLFFLVCPMQYTIKGLFPIAKH